MDAERGFLAAPLTASMSFRPAQSSTGAFVSLSDSTVRQDEAGASDRHSINDLLHHIVSITDQSLDEAQARSESHFLVWSPGKEDSNICCCTSFLLVGNRL